MIPKTNGDLMLALLEQLGGPAMRDDFQREMLPLLFGGGRSAKWNEPLDELHIQHGLAQIARELPALRQYLTENDRAVNRAERVAASSSLKDAGRHSPAVPGRSA